LTVADGANDFFFRDNFQRVPQIIEEPVLASYRPGFAARVVLVVVHQDETVGDFGDPRIVERLIVDRHRDVELHALGMQVVIKLLHQIAIVRARALRECFDVEREALVLVRCQEPHELVAEALARRRIGHELRR